MFHPLPSRGGVQVPTRRVKGTLQAQRMYGFGQTSGQYVITKEEPQAT